MPRFEINGIGTILHVSNVTHVTDIRLWPIFSKHSVTEERVGSAAFVMIPIKMGLAHQHQVGHMDLVLQETQQELLYLHRLEMIVQELQLLVLRDQV